MFFVSAVKEVLRCHRRALDCHGLLRLTPSRIRILIHVFHRREHKNQYRRLAYSASRPKHVGFDGLRRVTVGGAILAQTIGHCVRDLVLEALLFYNDKTPRLTVVGGRC
nr:hypothetical protein [Variovorax sp. dw_308]